MRGIRPDETVVILLIAGSGILDKSHAKGKLQRDQSTYREAYQPGVAS